MLLKKLLEKINKFILICFQKTKKNEAQSDEKYQSLVKDN